jgi:hypothetical protein
MSGVTRGQIQLTDAALGFFTLVAFLVLSPLFVVVIDAATAEASGFTQLVFMLVLPSLVIGLLLSLGVSAGVGG